MASERRQLRSVWESIVQSTGATAVLVFDHGIEKVPLAAETPYQAAQVEKTLREFPLNLVGVYDGRVDFSTFSADVADARARR